MTTATLSGSILNPLGNIDEVTLRITPLDSRLNLLKHLASTSSISGSYSLEVSEGYYHFDYLNGANWISLGDGYISGSQTLSIQDVLNLEQISKSPVSLGSLSDIDTTGAENGDVLTYVDGVWVPLSASVDSCVSSSYAETASYAQNANIDLSGYIQANQTSSMAVASAISASYAETFPLIQANATVYVSKAGNDSNQGTDTNKQKLTIGSAITKAADLITAGASSVAIRITDGGTYTENISLQSNIHLVGEAATLVGSIGLPSDCSVNLHTHYASANNQTMVNKTGGSGHGFYHANKCDGRGTTGGLTGVTVCKNGSNGSVLFAHIGVIFVSQDGIGFTDDTNGFGHIHLWTPDLYLAGDNAIGIFVSKASSNHIGYIDHILEINSPSNAVGVELSNSTAVVKLTVSEIVCTAAYKINFGNLYLNCAKLTGTRWGTPISEISNITFAQKIDSSVTSSMSVAFADTATSASYAPTPDLSSYIQESETSSLSVATASFVSGPSSTTITVPSASAMQTIIDSGTVKVGQLFSLVSDRSIRRFEGNGKSRIISDLPQGNPTGYVRMTSVKTSNIPVTVRHDGTDGATGICYSVNGGAATYTAGASGANINLTITHAGGSPLDIAIWPASSGTSGRKGNLTYLWCFDNQLTSLDVSGLTALQTLYCFDNQLTSLDVSGLTALANLDCVNNSLTSLDVSGLTALQSLWCYDNSLTSLDVSGLTALQYLYCYNNQLTSLDVSGLTALTIFNCSNNSLTSLDVSGLTALEELDCSNNSQLTTVIAVGTDGAAYNSYSYYSMNFTNCGLTTDAVYSMLSQMVTADPQPSWINLQGNPCDGGTSLTDGTTYTGVETEALATLKFYTLII